MQRMSHLFRGRVPGAIALKVTLVWFLAILLVLGVFLFFHAMIARAASGPLTVEIGAAHNLVVDSNVSSPSTYAPAVATVMGTFCNTSTVDTLTGVWGYIGDFGSNTPGLYPSRDSTTPSFFSQHEALSDTGTYAFTHIGGRAGLGDASRYVGDLAPGECKVQYWHFTYPRCSDSEDPPCSGTPVWGDSVKPNDDLWLEFDIWATADGGWSADTTRRMTMRNEISAMANKIEPNGNPGGRWFNTDTDQVEVGSVITSNGVHYNFGNVRHGFDNDGDFVPDYNAWAQPIGDPSFDPSCFRLIRTTGILTVSRGAGKPDMIIPFVDQLYFMNLPPDNNGVDGNVYYTFEALDGPCNTDLTPYQEVASGFDNEKFNGDYGAGIPPVVSEEPKVSLDKSGNITVTPGARITYTLDFKNNGDSGAGLPLMSAPLVFSDSIPAGTTFVTDSTSASADVTILYSIDGGDTWTTTKPASGVTHVQWWLSDTLASGASGVITFAVEVDSTPLATPFVENCADARIDSASAFTESCFTTMISGTNSIGDFVWRDLDRDGVQDGGGETGIATITLYLYWDMDDNGTLDSDDPLLKTGVTDGSGGYLFNYLPDGDFLVVVDDDDPDLPLGYRNTTPIVHAVPNLGISYTNYLTADFGFGPTLDVRKSLLESGGYEGRELIYVLTVQSLRPGGGETVGDGCRYLTWADVEASQTSGSSANKQWIDRASAFGAGGPDSFYAYSDYTNAENHLAGTDYFVQGSGTVSSVVAVFSVYVEGTLGNDLVSAQLYYDDDVTPITTTTFLAADLNTFGSGPSNQGLLSWDVTDELSWNWSNFAGNLDLEIDTTKTGGKDGATVYLDALGFDIIVEGACLALDADEVIDTVPLTDTFDADSLQFVSADPAQTSVDGTTGVITWTNVGPIYPGESKAVRVTFLISDVVSQSTITNTTCVSGAVFSDGWLASNACATATGFITATGYISGVVWSDLDSDGWIAADGYESGESFIPNTTAFLYQCVPDPESGDEPDWLVPPATNQACTGSSNDGIWSVVDSQQTDANGGYLFEALTEGYYWVVISTTTMADTPSQTGDPDVQSGACGGSCDDQWQDDSTLNGLTKLDPVAGTDAITNINFGYSVSASLFGYVWEDNDGDGVWEDGENGLDNGGSGITVTLWYSNGTQAAITQTNASGYYEFTGLVSDTYTITVGTSTLPPGSTWRQTDDPDAVLDDEHTVSVSNGELSGPHNFGYTRNSDGPYEIGDTVYADWNGDGEQDEENEAGLNGVTVSLYEDSNGDGTIDTATDGVITSTVTTANGLYTFTGLVTGTYIVVVDETGLPSTWSNYIQTQDPDVDGEVCTGTACDSRGSSEVSSTLTSDLTVDFGYQPRGFGSIGDTVWRDMNGDGAQAGPQETGIADITVWLEVDLDGDGTYTRVATDTTDSDGKYLFEDLPDANYRVVVDTNDSDLPSDSFGYKYVLSTNAVFTRTISGGNTYLDADFGFMPMGAIGDTIYWDANENGDLDWNETGIENVVVTLTNMSAITTSGGDTYPAGDYELTATTTVTGFYLFTGLPAGTYSVTVGTVSGDPTLTGDPDTNGIPCPELDPGDFLYPFCDGQTDRAIRPGTVFLGADFGYIPPGVIGDYVWRDLDNDGVQDPFDMGIPGITVTVTNGSITQTTVTDFDGYYSFANLGDDTWTVTFAQPTNMTPTVTSVGAITSGVGSVGLGTSVVIGGDVVTSIEGTFCTTCSLYIDSGFVLNGDLYISGTVFYDASGMAETNDAFTTGDTPYANITVYLYDSSHTLIGQTTTDASGHYTFTNLINGVYTVSVNASAPQLSNQDLSAVNTYELANYHTVSLSSVSVTDVDFGFYAQMDFGDLPDTYSLTHLADEGPYHITGTLHLGPSVTSESDGVESGTAEGDADDGVIHDVIHYWIPGNTVNLTVTVTGGNGYLISWFDWTGDGDFNDANERVTFGSLAAGVHTLDLVLPSNYDEGRTLNARFRLYDGQPGTVSPTGSAVNGEVEDYQWEFGPNVITMQSFTASSVERVHVVVLALVFCVLGAGVLLVLRRRARRRA